MTAMELQDVRHAFQGRSALERMTVSVAPGEVVALIGLNGAGKTTAMRVLAGRLHPDAGCARVLGADPTRLPRQLAARFGQLVGAPLVYPELTVRENLRAAALLHGMPRREIGVVEAAVARWDLGSWADAPARGLSQGNRQRLAVACTVLHNPAALVLDEPTTALDPRGVVIVREEMRKLAAGGSGVLVSSHHLDEVARVADRILVVHAGRVVGTLEPGGTDLEQRFFAMALEADMRSQPIGTGSRR